MVDGFKPVFGHEFFLEYSEESLISSRFAPAYMCCTPAEHHYE